MGIPFNGVPRQIAVPSIAVAAVGWLLVVIAFGITTIDEGVMFPVDRSDPVSYPFWMVSLCGPLIVITALIHAALWKPISPVIGAITSFLSVLFLTALGMLLFGYGEFFSLLSEELPGVKVPVYMALGFAGSIIATLFWTLLMILWLFYDGYKSTSEDNATVLFRGIARKIVLPFIGLTGVGWLLVVIGFVIGLRTPDDELPALDFLDLTNHDSNDPSSYLYWVVCISGPFVFVAAAIHAALWKPIGSIVGAVTVFLNAFFLTGLGMILYINGDFIRQATDADIDVPAFYALEFAGAFLATLFWTPVMVLWHYYDGDSKA